MSDLIYRQMAIESAENVAFAIDEHGSAEGWLAMLINTLEMLPSAEPEVIRCKDCKWWDKDDDTSYGFCRAMRHGYYSSNWEISIYRKYKGDFFCGDAERGETDD